MSELTYIYENEHDMTCFDKYFEYLETIKALMPAELMQFAVDRRRYQLNGDHTLHDSWLKDFNVKKEYNPNNQSTTSVQLQLLQAKHLAVICLNYGGVTEITCSLTPDRWVNRPVDLLVHEFIHLEGSTFKHSIQFDRSVWLNVSFSSFSFQEELTTL
jgi:hypothetical protein